MSGGVQVPVQKLCIVLVVSLSAPSGGVRALRRLRARGPRVDELASKLLEALASSSVVRPEGPTRALRDMWAQEANPRGLRNGQPLPGRWQVLPRKGLAVRLSG